MCRWPTSLARSIRSFGAGSHITDDICHRPSVPSFVTSIRCCGLGRCGSLSASQVIRRGQDAFLKSYPGLTRASLFTGRSHWSARSPDGSEVRRESHASFCERLGVQLLRPTHQATGNPVPLISRRKALHGHREADKQAFGFPVVGKLTSELPCHEPAHERTSEPFMFRRPVEGWAAMLFPGQQKFVLLHG